MSLKTIDLFAGIGGIRRGFEMTGIFSNVLSAEIDKYACETYTHLYGDNPYNDVTSEEFKNKVEKTNYDVLLGGFPCQSFSIAGKKEGLKDGERDKFSFPKDISITQQYKLFGNSVSIPVIEEMAKYMYKRLEEFNAIQ